MFTKISQLFKVFVLILAVAILAMPITPASAAGNTTKGSGSYDYHDQYGCILYEGHQVWSWHTIINGGVEKYQWRSSGNYSATDVCSGQNLYSGSWDGGSTQTLKNGQTVQVISHYRGTDGDRTYKSIYIFTGGEFRIYKIIDNGKVIKG